MIVMMFKKEMKSLCIGKSLLCLLAMFLMLLAPQAAWAQTDYGLTVAGVPVTSTNANNITGGGISGGTVSYDGTNTLTLNGVTINGSIVVSSDFGDLVVKLVGNSVIQGVDGAPLTSGISTEGGSNSGKLTFVIDGNTSGSLFFPYVTTPIEGFANIEYLNGLEWGCRDEGTTTDYVEGVGTEVVLASIGASLYVTKTKTTMTLSDNGGTVTYRKDDTLGRHVLTLSGLTDLNNCISWYSPDDVTIEISGTNNSMSFSSSGTYNSVCFEGKPQSNISFRFTGSTATLKMYDRSQSNKSLGNPWISGFGNASNPTLSDGLKMVEIDEYRYDSQDNQTKHVERYITTETYGLNVKGIQVHNLEGVNVGHKDHILGLTYNEQTQKHESDTSITFNSSDSGNILTLNNATISYTTGNAIVSSITTPLTVYLTGENSISSGDYLPFEGAIGDNANLVFTTNTTGTPGSLTMTSTHTDFGPTSFFDGFKQILYPEEQGLLAAKSVNGNVVISAEQATDYGLKVAGVTVTSANASNVLGVLNENDKPTVVFDADNNKLTLNNANISVGSEDAVVSGLENLKIFLVGENYITSYGKMFNKTSAVGAATITFTTEEGSNGSLSFMCGEEDIFGDEVTPVYTYVFLKDEGDTHTITSSCGISVGGVPVTLFNSTDVFGDGTVWFTPAVPETDNKPAVPAILTLNGATIECDEEQESPGIVYENEDDLTIALIGNNSIQGTAACTAIEKRYGVETPKLSFAKGVAAQHFSLTLIADSEEGWIDGFKANYGDFFVFDDEDNGTYTRTISSSRALDVAFVENNLWATYYATKNLTVPDGLTAYIVSDVNETTGEVTVGSIGYIPANNGVLLMRAEGGDARGYVAAPYTGTTATFTNLLAGSTNTVAISSFGSSPVYVLFNDKFKRATSGTIPARRAYLPLAVTSSGAPQLMTLNVVDGISTAISTLTADDNDGSWYTLDGLKLSGKPQHKGVFINNRKKVYFKNK